MQVAMYFSMVGTLTASSRKSRLEGSSRAAQDRAKATTVAMCGVPNFGWMRPRIGGREPARPMANRKREKTRKVAFIDFDSASVAAATITGVAQGPSDAL